MDKIRFWLIAVAVMMACITYSFAEENTESAAAVAHSKIRKPTPEQIEYWESFCNTHPRSPKRTLEEARNSSQQNGSRGWLYAMGGNWYFAQETNYSCAPACVRMALKRITGTTYSESTIRTGCNTSPSYGTYTSDMATYINSILVDYDDEYYYLVSYTNSLTTMKSNLYFGIAQCGLPSIVCVNEKPDWNWPYELLDGHAVLVDGVTENQWSYRIWDPWAGYIQDTGWTNKTCYVIGDGYLFAAYDDAGLGYMY